MYSAIDQANNHSELSVGGICTYLDGLQISASCIAINQGIPTAQWAMILHCVNSSVNDQTCITNRHKTKGRAKMYAVRNVYFLNQRKSLRTPDTLN